MIQDMAPAAAEQQVAPEEIRESSTPTQQASPKVSRLARVALWLSIGIPVGLVLITVYGVLMGQDLVPMSDLPEMGVWVLAALTLVTPVPSLIARARIGSSGGMLTGRGLVKGSLWLTGFNGVVLTVFFLLMYATPAGASMCGGG